MKLFLVKYKCNGAVDGQVVRAATSVDAVRSLIKLFYRNNFKLVSVNMIGVDNG